MNFKTQLSAIALQFLAVVPALAFEVPSDGETRQNRAVHGVVLSDLLVGDKMRIDKWSTCVEDGQLMVFGFAKQDDPNEYSPEIVVEVVSGRSVAVTVSTTKMTKPDKADVMLMLWPCLAITGTAELIPVNTVNGFDSLDAYLGSDFVTKLPDPD
jgi:hypothetical protein